MSFYFAGEEWSAEDFVVGSALSMPGVAPFTIPYYVRTGRLPTFQEAVIALYAGIGWGALSRGGSLFINAQSAKLLVKSIPTLAGLEVAYQTSKVTGDLIESVARGTQTSAGRHPKPSWMPLPVYHMIT